jgi:pyruvate dehydrogenase E1 component
MGATMPEVVSAADELGAGGIAVDVVCVTSADLLYRAARADRGFGSDGVGVLGDLFRADRPLVTVLDGHPSTLAFIGSALDVASTALGVDDFGQSGDPASLYEHYAIDAEAIVGAALDLL